MTPFNPVYMISRPTLTTRFLAWLCLALTLPFAVFAAELPRTAIVVAGDEAPAVRRAADELRTTLAALFPDERFATAAQMPAAGRAILVGTVAHAAPVARSYPAEKLAKPESFVVGHAMVGGHEHGFIVGADARGAAYGVYALLEKLGCGFYLSYDTMPPARAGALSFEDWSFADEPLFADRIVLNWHNFLSSATTWEWEDWQRYIDASVRMRFNDLMVHMYGNNPMFTFDFNGVAKPVGYFATTALGRDWGTQHVNDVRRMIGGEVFSDPVFGATIAKGDPAQRAERTTAFMQRVFAYARDRGLNITLAVDVDTVSANPQEIIKTLPAVARFRSGTSELVNPDDPAGYPYYKAQVEQLLARYPQVNRLAVWFRDPTANTPWRRLKREEMPAAWRSEFTGPDADISAFALAKVVRAFRQALTELGRADVRLAAGSWAFPFLAASDRYVDADVPLIALDWGVNFDGARQRRDLLAVNPSRRVIPIVWAHHDDHTYVGRPYTPFVDFATKLEGVRAAGYGIIHWTTRPLDLYFHGTMVQTWLSTKDQPLHVTCDNVAQRTFGLAARESGGRYLFDWVIDAPMFGRETTATFMDQPLPKSEQAVKLGKERLQLLDQIDRSRLSSEGATRLDYFRRYESFVLAFYASQVAVERAAEALKAGSRDRARAELGKAHPEDVIRAYVEAAQSGHMTRGEEAILVTLNLRWLPHVLSLRQAAGLDPVRYRLGKVLQEPLAQGASPNTYYFDEQKNVWKVIDDTALAPQLRLRAFSGQDLAPGRYNVSGVGEVEAGAGAVDVPTEKRPVEIVITPVGSGG